jgi:hypothetical protein
VSGTASWSDSVLVGAGSWGGGRRVVGVGVASKWALVWGGRFLPGVGEGVNVGVEWGGFGGVGLGMRGCIMRRGVDSEVKVGAGSRVEMVWSGSNRGRRRRGRRSGRSGRGELWDLSGVGEGVSSASGYRGCRVGVGYRWSRCSFAWV